VQKPATRAASRKGRRLNGGTRSLRAAALPFPLRDAFIPRARSALTAKELRETSLNPEEESNVSQQNVNTPAQKSKESSPLKAKAPRRAAKVRTDKAEAAAVEQALEKVEI
jgi:hypothetical protein